MDDETLTRLREKISRELFGRKYRAEIGAAIGDAKGHVCGKDLVSALGGPPPEKGAVSSELQILKEVGLLSEPPKNPNDRRTLYEPDHSSGYWAFCQELRRRAAQP